MDRWWMRSLALATGILLATAGSSGAATETTDATGTPERAGLPEVTTARQALEALDRERSAFDANWREQVLTGAAADQAHSRALQGFEKRRAQLLVDLNLAQGNLAEAARWSEWLRGQEHPTVSEPLNLERVSGQLQPTRTSQPVEVAK